MPFSSLAYVTRRDTFLVDPIYVADYGTLRSIATGSLLAFITGYFADGGASASTAGWFRQDPNDHTTADNDSTTIVDTQGRRWKRIYANDGTGLPVGTELTVKKLGSDALPWVAIGIVRITKISLNGVLYDLSNFTIVGNQVTAVAAAIVTAQIINVNTVILIFGV